MVARDKGQERHKKAKGMPTQGEQEESYGEGHVLYLDYKCKYPVILLYYCFVRRYHLRKLGEVYMQNLCIISYDYVCEPIIISKLKAEFRKIKQTFM